MTILDILYNFTILTLKIHNHSLLRTTLKQMISKQSVDFYEQPTMTEFCLVGFKVKPRG